jgi:hypothetical protein
VTLQLNSVSDVAATIAIDGPPVSVTTALPGQHARLTFSATTAAHVILNLADGAYTSCTATLYNPGGFSLTSGSGASLTMVSVAASCAGDTNSIDTEILAPGTYTILIAPGGTATGTVTAQLSSVADVTTAVTIDGPAGDGRDQRTGSEHQGRVQRDSRTARHNACNGRDLH